MASSRYQRGIDDLEALAVKWWPNALVEREADSSVVPILLSTLDSFLSVLKISSERYDQVFDVLSASSLPGNVFLKHLCVLADFGGEPLMRIGREVKNLFPLDKTTGKHVFRFYWNEQIIAHQFRGLPAKGLSNGKLRIDGESLSIPAPLDAVSRDVAVLLLYGSKAEDERLALETFWKCEIGSLLGLPSEIETFVRQRYIFVSRITSGATANKLGQIAQQYVRDFLLNSFRDCKVSPGVIKVAGEDEAFDIVVEKGGRSVGIEVSFQVTTNSTIERKAKQAQLRYPKLKAAGIPVAYVIDGAGNFQRRHAISTICRYSDCTVAYSDSELGILARFVMENLG
jgi:hypothetical protein